MNNIDKSFWKHVFDDMDNKVVISWTDAIEKNIQAYPELLNEYNSDGLNPIQWAAFNNKIPTTWLETFLNYNVDIHQKISEPNYYSSLTLLEAIKQSREDLINSHETVLLSTHQRLDKIELMLTLYQEKQHLETKIKITQEPKVVNKI